MKDTLTILGISFPLSVVVLIILLVGFLIFCTLFSSKDILIIFKKTKFIASNAVIVAVLNVFLNFYLIPLYGLIGAAIATSVSFIIGAILIGTGAYLTTKINVFRFKYLTIFSSAILAIVVTFIFKSLFGSIDILSLILYPFIFVLVYLFLLIITKSLEKEDIYIMKALQRKISNRVNRRNTLP